MQHHRVAGVTVPEPHTLDGPQDTRISRVRTASTSGAKAWPTRAVPSPSAPTRGILPAPSPPVPTGGAAVRVPKRGSYRGPSRATVPPKRPRSDAQRRFPWDLCISRLGGGQSQSRMTVRDLRGRAGHFWSAGGARPCVHHRLPTAYDDQLGPLPPQLGSEAVGGLTACLGFLALAAFRMGRYRSAPPSRHCRSEVPSPGLISPLAVPGACPVFF